MKDEDADLNIDEYVATQVIPSTDDDESSEFLDLEFDRDCLYRQVGKQGFSHVYNVIASHSTEIRSLES